MLRNERSVIMPEMLHVHEKSYQLKGGIMAMMEESHFFYCVKNVRLKFAFDSPKL